MNMEGREGARVGGRQGGREEEGREGEKIRRGRGGWKDIEMKKEIKEKDIEGGRH